MQDWAEEEHTMKVLGIADFAVIPVKVKLEASVMKTAHLPLTHHILLFLKYYCQKGLLSPSLLSFSRGWIICEFCEFNNYVFGRMRL